MDVFEQSTAFIKLLLPFSVSAPVRRSFGKVANPPEALAHKLSPLPRKAAGAVCFLGYGVIF